MIYVSSLLNCKVRTYLENRRIETLWVELKLKSQIIFICCYYRSERIFVNVYKRIPADNRQALDYTPNVILLGVIMWIYQLNK